MSSLKENQKNMSQIFVRMARPDWTDLIQFLHRMDLKNMESDMVVGSARSIYTGRQKLGEEYDTFVLRAFEVLNSRGLNAERILKGLL